MTDIIKRLLITGGGSGGHIFPGLAVAHYLMKKGWEVYWLGSMGSLDREIISKYNINIKFIRVLGFREKSFLNQLKSLLYLLYSIIEARRIVSCWKPDIVLGFGGYVSASVGIAAWSCGCPLILHEQNSIPGLTNRILGRTIAKKVLQAFPGAFSGAEMVGNPIRSTILAVQDPEKRLRYRTGPIRLLVIGGSQGASIFNYILPQIASIFVDKLIIWHQVGRGYLQSVSFSYGSMVKCIYRIVEFIDDIAAAYAWADIVMCRSGALTVSEISVVGLAAIFVPFTHRDYHQYWNAMPLQQIGAAKIVQETEFTITYISQILRAWDSRLLLLKMAKRAKLLGIPDATKRVVYNIINQ